MQDFSYGGIRAQEALPKTEPYQLYRRDQSLLIDTKRLSRDFEYFKSLYPSGVKRLQQFVEEVCDEMEYEGSPIYDEYPDRLMMEQLVQKIGGRVPAFEEPPVPESQPDWEQPASGMSLSQEFQEEMTQPPAQQPLQPPQEIPPQDAASEQEDDLHKEGAREIESQEVRFGRDGRAVNVSYGPVCGACGAYGEHGAYGDCGECEAPNGGYRTWEMEETEIQELRNPSPPPRPP